MNRRTVLRALGGGVVPFAGCSGLDPPGSLPDTGQRALRLSSVDAVPEDVPLVPSVEVVRSRITADRTAQIRVSATNTADQPVWKRGGVIPAFSSYVTYQGPQGERLLLLKPDEQYNTASAGCWRVDPENRYPHFYSHIIPEHHRYAAGETKRVTFAIYGNLENANDCLVPGDYPVEEEYAVTAAADAEEPKWAYDWGFTLTVADA